MSSYEPTAEDHAFLQELKGCLGNTGANIEADILLAIASQFLGMLLAHQDTRVMDVERAMAIILHNIQIGNNAAVEEMTRLAGRPN